MHGLSRYLSRLFLARNLTVSLGMVAILGVLDALSKGDILPPDAGLQDHMKFMVLRAPLIFEQVFIFAFLLSLLITYVALIRRNELVAVVYAGLSAMGQIRALAPAVLMASLAYVALIDQAAPRAQKALTAWLGPEAVVKTPTLSDDLWITDEKLLVRIKSVEDGMLKGITLFHMAEEGKMAAVSFANSAKADAAGWRLSGVRQVRYDNQEFALPRYWRSTLDPDTLRLLALEPRYLSVKSLWELSMLEVSGNRTASAYQVWIYSRLALPIAALAFMVVTVIVMQRFGRNAKPELILVVAMAGGFVYVIFDSISKTLPDTINVTAPTAALAPLACLLLVCVVLALRSGRS